MVYLLAVDPGIEGFISVLFKEGDEQQAVDCSEENNNNNPTAYCLQPTTSILPIISVPIPVKKIKLGKTNKTRVDEEAISILINNLITKYNITEAVIEKQQAMSKRTPKGNANQGITSTGTTMEHYGFLKGYLSGIKLPYKVVHSKTWQSIYPKELALNKNLTTKDRSAIYCTQLFPEYNLKKTPRCKNIADGITDSILIGYWYLNEQ